MHCHICVHSHGEPLQNAKSSTTWSLQAEYKEKFKKMSEHSAVTTRGQLRQLAAEQEKRRAAEEKADSGLPSDRAIDSASMAPTATSSLTPVIPAAGGRVIDHRIIGPPPAPTSGRRNRPGSLSSGASSVGSRRSTDFRKKRAEYEAERELVRIRESLVRKKLEVDLAEIEATITDDEEDTLRRVEDWVETTPRDVRREEDAPAAVHGEQEVRPLPRKSVTIMAGESPFSPNPGTTRNEPPRHAHVSRIRQARGETAAPTPNAQHADHVTQAFPHEEKQERLRRTPSTDRRDRGIDQLADAITKLARPRPVPRQAYELPYFNGNSSDWITYKHMYYETSQLYEFQPHENLARIRTSLQGEAKAAVEDLLRSSTNPKQIMDALDMMFGHPVLILECAIKKIKALPKVSASGRELPKFAAAVRNCVSLLRNIRADGYLNNPQLINELLGKLTQSQREKYGDFAMGMDQGRGVDLRVSPNLEMLSEFLDHLSHAASYYTQMEFNVPAGTLTATARQPLRTTIAQSHRFVPRAQVQQVHVQSDLPTTSTQCKNNEQKVKCLVCDAEHSIVKCPRFLDMCTNDRWLVAKNNKLCFKCLVKRHSRDLCKAKRCETCNYSHHVLLHADKPATETVTNVGEVRAKALLKVLPVSISHVNGLQKDLQCYALLDDGATVSLIDSELVKDATGPVVPLVIRSARGHEVSDNTSRVLDITLSGPNGHSHKVQCRSLVRMDLPAQSVAAATIDDCAHLRGLGCEEMRDAKPLLLLGQDNWELLVSQDIRQGKSGKPVASLTSLGWVLHGPVGGARGQQAVNCMAASLTDLHEVVRAQFELESIGIAEDTRKHRDIERAVEILDNTSRRTADGSRWETGLLWKRDEIDLPDNRRYAQQRLDNLEKKMERNAEFAATYTAQVERLVHEGYAREVTGGLDVSPVWYLPHFGVVNPNKPGKLRLVFDAAATFRGICLNDNLLVGPDLLNSLLGILLKFRLCPVAFSGDIKDMFLRINIRKQDRGAQLFLWRGEDKSAEPKTYAMNAMIFGAVSSPTTASYILKKNAGEYKNKYPQAVEAIRSKHYMDDYLDSAWTVEQASQLISEVTRVHAAGGFEIRGWVTNSPALRQQLKVSMPERVSLEKGDNAVERTLGMIWSPEADLLTFDLSFKRLPDDIVSGTKIPTKREFLRFIMSIFDPLGFVYPCIIQSRIIMQQIWKSGIGWDEPLRANEAKSWFGWLASLVALREINVPRFYGIDIYAADVELHVFGDSSELAYASVGYLLSTNPSGVRETAIVMGKARVAPQKVISIPRLELQAAVLTCRLARTIKNELALHNVKTYLWTDSKTVLKWINSDAHEFQRFVSHRLSEIDKHSRREDWHWVPTSENPADKATRWDWPSNCKEWFSGPSFLTCSQRTWPASDGNEVAEADLERAHRVHVTAAAPDAAIIQYERHSTWTRAVRVVARALAFVERCRRRRASAALTADDLHNAEQYLFRTAQRESFAPEAAALQSGLPLPKSSKIRNLDPMQYEDGLLRVRGRLKASEELNFGERHPIILDGRHPLTRLLIFNYHRAALHANHETVINNIRERFWVTHLRPTVKAVTGRCQLCRIRRAKPTAPKMGDLPTARIHNTRRGFVEVGVDYFGPMEVTIGRRREKRWGALYTCLVSRAVHLEIASSLSADSAILTLRRLIARRGQPAHIFSDRGTNFVGANTELRAALRNLDQESLRDEATRRGIKWTFNSPASPHMGGSWERLVRSVKNALKATLNERAPREEVLHTLLAEAELIVNSRPLTYVTSDSEQPVVLTPNHLLLGTASGSTTFTRRNDDDVSAKQQWRKVNALADLFWRRWRREYLPTLQQRQKWIDGAPNVKEGDVVIIIEDNKPRNQWSKGVIAAVHQGKDAVVRIVDIRTERGIVRRPVVKIAVLPTEQSDVIG